MNIMRAGWLSDITDWIVDAIVSVWNDFVEFVSDMFVFLLNQLSLAVTYVLEKIPVPDFMNTYTLQSLLGGAGSDIAWFITIFKIDIGGTVIGAAIAFYIVRRFVTLGIW